MVRPAATAMLAPSARDGVACDDQRSCTDNMCNAGACVVARDHCSCTKNSDCPSPDQCHFQSQCAVRTGVCVVVSKPNGTACDDGTACTSGEVCTSGACGSPVAQVVCKGSDACHVPGVCDPMSGKCSDPPGKDVSACVAVCTKADCAPPAEARPTAPQTSADPAASDAPSAESSSENSQNTETPTTNATSFGCSNTTQTPWLLLLLVLVGLASRAGAHARRYEPA